MNQGHPTEDVAIMRQRSHKSKLRHQCPSPCSVSLNQHQLRFWYTFVVSRFTTRSVSLSLGRMFSWRSDLMPMRIGLLAVAAWITSLISGCTAWHGKDLTESPFSTQALYSSSVPNTPIVFPESTDPLLQGINADDLAKIQALAKRVHLQHWPVIAERSRYVRQRVISVLNRLQAPTSLQVVPVVESGYNPYALSYAGAMGLWQLMPRTARVLGIRKEKNINGRRDVEISTDAAVRYLLQLYKRFGNWPLALAAYHAGPNAVARSLRKHPWKPSMGLDAMPFPSATRSYVQNILGIVALLKLDVLTFPDPEPTETIVLQPPVDLLTLATFANFDAEELFKFNPGLNRAQYLQQPIKLHVPFGLSESLTQAEAKFGPKFVLSSIRQGDTLWKIARRHHITVNYLKRLNPGIGHILRIGQRIKVPANQLARASALPNPLLSRGRRIRYRVRHGDSLWSIAQRFGTSTRAITRSNQISTDETIHPGDTLWILARIRPG